MKTDPKTYTFSTFQELVDVVPADKIEICLAEIARVLAQGKAMAMVALQTAKDLAEQNGHIIPNLPDRVVTVPEVINWIDDGKGEVTTRLGPFPGGGTISVKTTMDHASQGGEDE